MKKIFIIALTFLLVGCQSSNNDTNKQQNSTTNQTTENNNDSTQNTLQDKTLVAYFTRVGNTNFPDGTDASSSASLVDNNGELIGNTEYIANVIVEETKGDKFLIQTQTKYPSNYDELVDQEQDEKSNNSRPALATQVNNFDEYEVIYLGFPNWWYGMPMPVYSFLESYDFSSKTIIPFNTSGGSGFSNAIDEIKELCPNATVLDGYTTSGDSVENKHDEIVEWIQDVRK